MNVREHVDRWAQSEPRHFSRALFAPHWAQYFAGAGARTIATRIAAGTLHVAVPYDPNWSLTVDGSDVPSRRAFGSTLAFDVPTAGRATLTYDTPVARTLWLVVQMLVWLALLLAASRFRPARWRLRRPRPAQLADTSPVADLTAPIDAVAAGDVPSTGEEEPA